MGSRYVYVFANSEDFPEHFEGQNVLFSEVVEEFVDELFLFGVEDLGEYFAVVGFDHLNS